MNELIQIETSANYTQTALKKLLDDNNSILQTNWKNYKIISIINGTVFAVLNFLLIYFLQAKMVNVLNKTYYKYRAIYKHFIPNDTISKQKIIRAGLIQAGILKK